MDAIQTIQNLDGLVSAKKIGGREADQIIQKQNHRISEQQRKGRGAGINPAGRFEKYKTENFDDGWESDRWESSEEPEPFKTEVTVENAKKIITTNDSPDIGFEQSINPYRGCEHGCIYCYARPSHAYMGMSAGLDFEAKLFAKPNAAMLLRKELAAKKYEVKPIAMGTNTDPYQPIEKQWKITRSIIEVLNETNHPLGLVTKSALVTRDIDLLSEMSKKNLARVAVSITTLDRKLARTMEPRAATPTKRLETIKKLSEAGVPVTVMVAPLIPAVNDHEIERIIDAANANGATGAGFTVVRLPYEVKELFKDWMMRHYPDKYKRTLKLLRSMHGGKDYDSRFFERRKGKGPYAWQLHRRFELATKKYGMGRRMPMRTDLFQKPDQETNQMSLFVNKKNQTQKNKFFGLGGGAGGDGGSDRERVAMS